MTFETLDIKKAKNSVARGDKKGKQKGSVNKGLEHKMVMPDDGKERAWVIIWIYTDRVNVQALRNAENVIAVSETDEQGDDQNGNVDGNGGNVELKRKLVEANNGSKKKRKKKDEDEEAEAEESGSCLKFHDLSEEEQQEIRGKHVGVYAENSYLCTNE